jgi:hypothetical protein
MKHTILVMALLSPLPALAEAITLDTSRSVGPTVSITTPSGLVCSETAGDRPSLWLGGRFRDQKDDNLKNDVNTTGAVVDQTSSNTFINSNLFTEEAGFSIGAGIHIPFGGPPTGNCKKVLAVAQTEGYILVLDKLLDKKAITLAEYSQLVKDLMDDLNDKKEGK